tara:strand:+ start:7161 stop:8858 length:1698 start_codon:yes stop_codon:yes gene_type:complete
MANKVIRSSAFNKNFTVEYNVSKEKPGGSVAKGDLDAITRLNIIPKKGYILNADDFTSGYLPKEVESVTYENTTNKINEDNRVVAVVKLKDNFVMPKDFINIDIPVSGSGKVSANILKLTINIPNQDGLLTSVTPANELREFSRVVCDDKKSITYVMASKSSTNQDLLKVDIVALDGNYLCEADYVINSKNRKNYKIKTQLGKSDDSVKYAKNSIAKKAIVFNYTFPKENVISNSDIIDLKLKACAIIRDDYTEIHNDDGSCTPTGVKKKEAIYSYETSNVSSYGGNQIATVKGVPGSKFKLLIQDSSKKILNAETGVFDVGGSFIEGVIPGAKNGKSYGIYKVSIPKPISTASTSNDVVARIISDVNVLNPYIDIGEVDKFGNTVPTSTVSKQIKSPTLTFTFAGTGMTVTQANEDVAASTNLIVGPGVSGTTIDNNDIPTIDLLVSATSSSKRVYIARQPRFTYGGTYAAWGTDTDDEFYRLLDASGNAVVMDYNISDNKGNIYNIKLTAEGLGTAVEYELDSVAVATYDQISLRGNVYGVEFGTDDITIPLNLLNFLSVSYP